MHTAVPRRPSSDGSGCCQAGAFLHTSAVCMHPCFALSLTCTPPHPAGPISDGLGCCQAGAAARHPLALCAGLLGDPPCACIQRTGAPLERNCAGDSQQAAIGDRELQSVITDCNSQAMWRVTHAPSSATFRLNPVSDPAPILCVPFPNVPY